MSWMCNSLSWQHMYNRYSRYENRGINQISTPSCVFRIVRLSPHKTILQRTVGILHFIDLQNIYDHPECGQGGIYRYLSMDTNL